MSFWPSNPTFRLEFIFGTRFLHSSAPSVHHPTNLCQADLQCGADSAVKVDGSPMPWTYGLVGKRDTEQIMTDWLWDRVKDYWSEIGFYLLYKLVSLSLLFKGCWQKTWHFWTRDRGLYHTQHSKQLEFIPFAHTLHTGDAMGSDGGCGLHHIWQTEFREPVAFTTSRKQACLLSKEQRYFFQTTLKNGPAKGTVGALQPGTPGKVFTGVRGPQSTPSSNKDIKGKKQYP